MLVPISKITVNPGRREALPGDVKELADSIAEVGLINPIMVDQSHTLIAGLHRLEAMKLLGRTEIECTVSDLDGLQVALAEIDENFVRHHRLMLITTKRTAIIGCLCLRVQTFIDFLSPQKQFPKFIVR